MELLLELLFDVAAVAVDEGKGGVRERMHFIQKLHCERVESCDRRFYVEQCKV